MHEDVQIQEASADVAFDLGDKDSGPKQLKVTLYNKGG